LIINLLPGAVFTGTRKPVKTAPLRASLAVCKFTENLSKRVEMAELSGEAVIETESSGILIG
jgi:hypothetical protein